LEIYKLEKNVSVLATIAGAAPMLGFLLGGNSFRKS
jgi:biopolymer transport protein ExbB/TolQ